MTELLRKPVKVRHITRKEKGKSFLPYTPSPALYALAPSYGDKKQLSL
jgi:hypothetical protein